MTVALGHRVDGPASAPVVVLGPSLGTTWEMWDPLADRLSGTHRVVRYDTRGHGRSPAPPGPYTVDELADDVLALLDSLGVDRFAMVGLSLGGAVAQTLAVREPTRLSAAVLCCTVPSFGGPTSWAERAATVRGSGMSSIAEASRASHPDRVEWFVDVMTSLDPEGYAGCCEALGGFDVTADLGRIAVPVRVVAGAEDPVAVPSACEELAALVPGADLVVVPDTSHLATVAGEPFLRPVIEHLEAHL
jgi:3-oxoadipate enol-lactonase